MIKRGGDYHCHHIHDTALIDFVGRFFLEVITEDIELHFGLNSYLHSIGNRTDFKNGLRSQEYIDPLSGKCIFLIPTWHETNILTNIHFH